ncbi:transposase [Azospirillum sp. YIM B02556]|uniref:Transposase n=1 Tax=Azospirillum endophyticum TaxID=2800326 RepID=A0ABS1F7W7_9PROT|nr:transposase [Azospirillum endophyticum]
MSQVTSEQPDRRRTLPSTHRANPDHPLALKQFHQGSTAFTPAMVESTGALPRLSAVAGKPVHAAFDGGLLLLAEINRRLGICERLTACIKGPRALERIQHTLVKMIRFRALLIDAGYADCNDCDTLRSDPAFKMVVGRLPESGGALLAADHQPAGELAWPTGGTTRPSSVCSIASCSHRLCAGRLRSAIPRLAS